MPAFLFTVGGVIIKELLINEEIDRKKVRLIDETGEQVGIVSLDEALDRANRKNLDLCMIAPKATPSVCKIMDYGKYRYDMIKKEKEDKKNQKTIQVKEIRLSVNIESHDLNTKANQAKKFITAGNKVKVSVRFRGRELGHKELGQKVIDEFNEIVSDVSQIDVKPKMEGRSLVEILVKKAEK